MYLQNVFSAFSSLFSLWAKESLDIKSWHEIKYVLTLFLAASVPIPTLKCVFPTPGEPTNTIFFFSSINLNVAKSKISFLFIDGWKSKSNSSNVLLKGKCATFILYNDALSAWKSISFSVNSYSAFI